MRERLITYQEETGNNYNLEATPAEGTSYRLARIDKETYSDIICTHSSNSDAVPFYTNSSQLPVNFTDDMFELLDLQDAIQSSYTGGTVQHLFLGERIGDPHMVRNLVKKICTQYTMPYISITPTFSVCPEHGYLNGEQWECPHCGSQSEVYSRIVGYLRPVHQWNEGKRAEYAIRTMVEEKETV